MPHSSETVRHRETNPPIFAGMFPFLSRVSVLTRDIDIANMSVRLSVTVSYENSLTYRHSFSTIR